MFAPRTALILLGLTTVVPAQLTVSIGIRETEAGGGSFTKIGADGGSVGGIEWVNLDGQTLTLDGTWQKFTFNLTTDPLTGFAGSTGNGVLEGTFGTLEHIRLLNANGIATPITVWIDDVTDTVTPSGGSPVSTNFGDFEGYGDGTEVMFQEPSFSGSTMGNVAAGSTSGVDNYVASRSASCAASFQFIDGTPTRWVRLTTFNATNLANPLIRFDDSSVITFWMRSGTCQENLGAQGPGTAIAEMCGTGLNNGQTSVYYTADAPASAPGAIGISLPGQADLSLLGGTLVSGAGLALVVPTAADGSGATTFPLTGSGVMADLVFQSVFLDGTQPFGLTFTNAVQARYGQ